jgi:hypothetical protein
MSMGPEPERRSMSVQNDHQVSHSQADDAWADQTSDFVLVAEGKLPSRIELARERMLICRLYLGLMRTITDDYAEHVRRLCNAHAIASASINANAQAIGG